ncbi:MAG: hypothetical protein ACP5SI_04025 [Chloroflexia bacterium]
MALHEPFRRLPEVRARCPWWFYAGIYGLAGIFLGALAFRLPGPLDVDGAYYFLVARGLARGEGWRIPALWLFFHPPETLPQAVGELWLPMPSLLLVPFLSLGSTFRNAQFGQAVLAAALPLLALRTALDQGLRPRWAGVAALLTFLAGTVTVHWVDTDCFTAFALLAGASLWAAGRAVSERRFLLLAGALAGLAALTRNDGLLLLPVIWLSEWLFSHRRGTPMPWRELGLSSILFLIPPGLWGVRNFLVFGTPSPVPLPYLALLTDYHQLFRWQPAVDWAQFLAQGWGTLAALRAEAARAALTVVAAMFQLWGAGPLLLSLPHLPRRVSLWPPFLYGALLFGTLVACFPLLVTHGTWSRSIAAFLPAGAAAVAAGCSDLEDWLTRRIPGRRGNRVRAVLLLGVVGMSALVGTTALREQLKAAVRHPQVWQKVGQLLSETPSEGTVMAQDAMAVLLYTGKPAIGIPYEEPPLLLEIARRYDAQTLVLVGDLKEGLPGPLQALYEAGEAQEPGFSSGPFLLERKEDGIQIYRIRPGP